MALAFSLPSNEIKFKVAQQLLILSVAEGDNELFRVRCILYIAVNVKVFAEFFLSALISGPFGLDARG